MHEWTENEYECAQHDYEKFSKNSRDKMSTNVSSRTKWTRPWKQPLSNLSKIDSVLNFPSSTLFENLNDFLWNYSTTIKLQKTVTLYPLEALQGAK